MDTIIKTTVQYAQGFMNHIPSWVTLFVGTFATYMISKFKKKAPQYEEETDKLLKKIIDVLFMERLKTLVDRKLEDKKEVYILKDRQRYIRKKTKYELSKKDISKNDMKESLKKLKKSQKVELIEFKLDLDKKRFLAESLKNESACEIASTTEESSPSEQTTSNEKKSSPE
jgi:hypothetical protein